MYVERAPAPELAGRLACVWEQVSESGGVHLVVPDGCVDLIWGPGGPHVAGPDTGPMPTPMRVGDAYVGIRFRPGAVGAVFGVPLAELRDQRVPLADLPALAALTTEHAAMARATLESAVEPVVVEHFAVESGAAGPAGLRRIMLEAVVARLRETPPPDPAAPAIAAALRAGRSVAEVAWELGLSERQLHRRNLAGFGYAPKTLQRIVRFQRALRLARAGRPLADVAVESGYADQAHLANDVKRLSGVPLGKLLT